MTTAVPDARSEVITLNTLTPIWTGGVQRTSDRLHETGILGSMRWWYEAIVRGLGGHVCDPTMYDESSEKRCEVSKHFGRRGQQRLFRLEVRPQELEKPFQRQILVPSGRIREGRRPGGWYLGNGWIGRFELRVTMKPGENEETCLAWALPLRLIHYWTAIGAKTQHGFGVVEVNDATKLPSAAPDLFSLRSEPSNMPDLRHMFFAKLAFDAGTDWWKQVESLRSAYEGKVEGHRIPQARKELELLAERQCIPISPVFRNWLRYGNKTEDCNGKSLLKGYVMNQEREAEDLLFGRIRRDRIRSCFNVSSAYKLRDYWEVRVWGWVPDRPNYYDRDDILASLKDLLSFKPESTWGALLNGGCNINCGSEVKECRLIAWREFNSSRDTERVVRVPEEFMLSLVNGEGAGDET